MTAMRATTYDWGERLPTLGGQRLTLRWLGEGDVPALLDIFSDVEVMRYWSSPPLAGHAEAADLLRSIHQGFRERSLFQWGIDVPQEPSIVGTCTLYHLSHAHRRAEVGFALGRRHWGRGIASGAVATLIEFAFGTLDLHRLEADADPRNERSLRLLERQGFRREGHLRERYHVGGEIQDAVILGLLRGEWRPMPAARDRRP